MKNFFKIALLGSSALALASFVPPGDKKPKYIDRANMDLTVKPGDNFYLYADGNWLKNNPVPASKTRWGTFNILAEESTKRLKALLAEAAAKAASNPGMQQIGDFYTSGMDSARIEQLGATPIQADLHRIDALTSLEALLDEIALERTQGIGNGIFAFGVAQDRKNVTQYIPHIYQSGTTLPDRDYYLKGDARSTTIRKAYGEHLEKMFLLAGEDAAAARRNADAVLRIETALAKVQMSRTELRDPHKTYNKFSIKDFSALTPTMDWTGLLKKLKLNGGDSVVVNNPSFFKSADLLLTALPLQDWKAYVKWSLLNDLAPYLSSDFVKQDFSFTRVLTGQKEQSPRWQRISGLIDRQLGDLIGQLYVARHFKPEAKARMQELVTNLQTTFAARIQRLDWMSDETKARALEKLNAFTKKIGYPDKWKDYGAITIRKDDFLGNIRRANAWAYDDMVNRFGKPVDKSRWSMTPPTINAYYSPVNNEIVFPAGILQFPFFDFGASDAVNYGGIGAVIGHEMTHGFDDNGSQYAADGNLKNWWTPADAAQFKAKADKVVEQYNAYTVQDTLHVNGRLTLGENLADLGGLSIAYEAFTHTKQFKGGKKIDGFTPAQQFFLSWAQVWRTNITPQAEAQLILTDPHSPGVHRANGPLNNIDAWYEAFNVQPGDKMYKAPEQRIKIW
ncbi:M13 family metallopeptidase [Paraflavisolibacter sp. H34]|uniref:M13 family metallopeptidase n=1 Tax=Huijunlia imazamoxiresistens TaxID=3127457 RepID=UPI00301AD867